MVVLIKVPSNCLFVTPTIIAHMMQVLRRGTLDVGQQVERSETLALQKIHQISGCIQNAERCYLHERIFTLMWISELKNPSSMARSSRHKSAKRIECANCLDVHPG